VIRHVPNILTVIRMLMVPLFVYTFFINHVVAAVVFLTACATDILDGYIARKYMVITKFGTLFDPLADKLMQIAAIVCLYIAGIFPIWLMIILAAKEGIMILGAAMLCKKEIVIPSNIYGKINTVLLSVFVVASILFGAHFLPYITPISIVIAVFSITALVNYAATVLGRLKQSHTSENT